MGRDPLPVSRGTVRRRGGHMVGQEIRDPSAAQWRAAGVGTHGLCWMPWLGTLPGASRGEGVAPEWGAPRLAPCAGAPPLCPGAHADVRPAKPGHL
jgi:hypothetical protein